MTTLHWALLAAAVAVVVLVYLYSLRDDGMYWREEQERQRRDRDQLDLWKDVPGVGDAAPEIDEFGVGKPRTVKIEPTLDVADKVADRLEANRRQTATAASAASLGKSGGAPRAAQASTAGAVQPADDAAARAADGSPAQTRNSVAGPASKSAAKPANFSTEAATPTQATRPTAAATPAAPARPQPPADASASASSTISEGEAQKVIVFYLAESEGTHILGDRLHAALQECGLTYGRNRIYHRLADDVSGDNEVFSVASLLEPGTLDPAASAGFSTPGISVFMLLPGPVDPLQAYRDMIQTIGVLAERLNAQVLDEKRELVTRESAAHLHAEITRMFYAEPA